MMCSHTGSLMSFGHGAQHTKSSKQKLITKNSTEAKLVRVSEKLPYNIWMMNFLEYQVIVLEKSILYQDNQSAIYMELNGWNSCTETPRHINFGTPLYKKGRTIGTVGDCILSHRRDDIDFFTKPLQGSVFTKFRNQVMGHAPLLLSVTPSVSQEMKECVEVEDNSMQD